MYNYIHGYKPSIYPWQWDYNYEDDMMGLFYLEDLVAYKQILKLSKEGVEYRERKAVSVDPDKPQQPANKRPRFSFIKE